MSIAKNIFDSLTNQEESRESVLRQVYIKSASGFNDILKEGYNAKSFSLILSPEVQAQIMNKVTTSLLAFNAENSTPVKEELITDINLDLDVQSEFLEALGFTVISKDKESGNVQIRPKEFEQVIS